MLRDGFHRAADHRPGCGEDQGCDRQLGCTRIDGQCLVALAEGLDHNQGGQQRGWTFQRDGKLFAVRVDGDLACNDGELLFDWVRQGLGIGWRSTWEIQAELKRGELVTVLDEFAVGNYPIQAVFPQQRYLPAKIRHFIDHLKAVYNTPGYWELGAG